MTSHNTESDQCRSVIASVFVNVCAWDAKLNNEQGVVKFKPSIQAWHGFSWLHLQLRVLGCYSHCYYEGHAGFVEQITTKSVKVLV